MADLIEEVPDHGHAVFRVVHLRMVLHSVKAPGLVGNGGVGAHLRVAHQGEALRHLGHIVAVAHPGDALCGQAGKELAGGVVICGGLAVFPGSVLLGGGDQAAQGVGHQLTAVADAQNGDAPGEDFRVHLGGSVQIDAVGTAGEDNPDGVHGFQLRQGRGVRFDFTVDAALTHPAGDQLVVLAAKVQHKDELMLHAKPPFLFFL